MQSALDLALVEPDLFFSRREREKEWRLASQTCLPPRFAPSRRIFELCALYVLHYVMQYIARVHRRRESTYGQYTGKRRIDSDNLGCIGLIKDANTPEVQGTVLRAPPKGVTAACESPSAWTFYTYIRGLALIFKL